MIFFTDNAIFRLMTHIPYNYNTMCIQIKEEIFFFILMYRLQ